MNRAWIVLLTAAAGMGAAVPAPGDIVRFRNGREIEGVIREETDTHVIVDLGVGAMTVERGRIAAIVRSGEAANESLAESWRRKYFLHRRHVPAGLEDLAAAFRDVTTKRADAVRAQRSMTAADRAERSLREEAGTAREELDAVTQRLAAASPEDDLQAYNALVIRGNALRAALSLKHKEQAALREKREKTQERISAYTGLLPQFEAQLARAQAERTGSAPAGEREFLEQLAERLAGLQEEFRRTTAPADALGGGTVVDVVVNDRVQGRFLVDTGAALVTMSAAFAKRLGLSADDRVPTQVILADGRFPSSLA
jgi:hypothetical protein